MRQIVYTIIEEIRKGADMLNCNLLMPMFCIIAEWVRSINGLNLSRCTHNKEVGEKAKRNWTAILIKYCVLNEHFISSPLT